jgi:tetratricopeptide (TPR) repeat protein
VTPSRAEHLRSAVTRFSGQRGVVGAGVLVDRHHVLTCAHVVAAALTVEGNWSRPQKPVEVEFPYAQPAASRVGTVVGWSYDNTTDIALLRLDAPAPNGIRPPLLELPAPDFKGHDFWTIGFPSGSDRTGRQAHGTLQRRGANGWVHMEAEGQTGARVERGFSGAPVWDEHRSAVAGIVVEADLSPTERVAHLLPVDLAVEALMDAWSHVSYEDALTDCVVVGTPGAARWTGWLRDELNKRSVGTKEILWVPSSGDLALTARRASTDAAVVIVVVSGAALEEVPSGAQWEEVGQAVRQAGGRGMVVAAPFPRRRPPVVPPLRLVAARGSEYSAFFAEILDAVTGLLESVAPPTHEDPLLTSSPLEEEHADLEERTATWQRVHALWSERRRRSLTARTAGTRVSSRPEEFFDRVAPMERLLAHLRGQAPSLVSIVGPRGVGKSALALRVIDVLMTHGEAGWEGCPYDGVALLSTRSGSQEVTAERVMMLCSELLGEEGDHVRRAWAASAGAQASDRAAGLLEALAGSRILVLLDNMEDVLAEDGSVPDDELRALLNEVQRRPGEAMAVLTTSRSSIRLAGGPGIELRLEEGLPVTDAVDLLRRLDRTLDRRLAGASRPELLRLAERLGSLPRALQLFSAVLAGDRTLDPETLLTCVTDRERAVSELAIENYYRLNADARLVVDALAVLGRPSIPEALEWMAEPTLPGFRLEAVIARLVDIAVLSCDTETRRISMHPLDAEVARADLEVERPEQRRDLDRLAAAWYSKFPPPDPPHDLQDLDETFLRFEHLMRAGDVEDAAALISRFASFMVERGAAGRAKGMHQRLWGRISDEHLIMRLAHGYGMACRVGGPVTDAVPLFEECSEIAKRLGDVGYQADALFLLGDSLRYEGRPAQGVAPLRESVTLRRSMGDTAGELHAMLGLGLAYLYQGRPDDALDLGDDMHELANQLDTPRGWAQVLDLESLAHLVNGDPDSALRLSRMAVTRYSLNDESTGYVRNVEGLSLLALGRPEEALVAFEQGRLEGVSADAPRVEGLCLHNRAWSLWRCGDEDAGVAAAERARVAFARAGSRDSAASSMLASALRHARSGNSLGAAISAREAMGLSRQNVDLYAGPDLQQWAADLAREAGLDM